eukprot:1158006-Pelagomonas_calceolata.AAC.21
MAFLTHHVVTLRPVVAYIVQSLSAFGGTQGGPFIFGWACAIACLMSPLLQCSPNNKFMISVIGMHKGLVVGYVSKEKVLFEYTRINGINDRECLQRKSETRNRNAQGINGRECLRRKSAVGVQQGSEAKESAKNLTNTPRLSPAELGTVIEFERVSVKGNGAVADEVPEIKVDLEAWKHPDMVARHMHMGFNGWTLQQKQRNAGQEWNKTWQKPLLPKGWRCNQRSTQPAHLGVLKPLAVPPDGPSVPGSPFNVCVEGAPPGAGCKGSADGHNLKVPVTTSFAYHAACCLSKNG